MTPLRHAIGTTYESMQYLRSLGIPARFYPRTEFKPFSLAVKTGSLHVIGQGFATDTWDWGFLPTTYRNILKGYCSGLSAQVYVRVYNDSLAAPAWQVYRAIMLWTPEAEDRQASARMKLVTQFKLLELITE